MFEHLTGENAREAAELHARMQQLHSRGQLDDATFNYWCGQLTGTRMSYGERSDSLQILDGVTRFASLVPPGTFAGGEVPGSEARVEEVKREMARIVGLRDDRPGGPGATRLSRGTTADDDGAPASPSVEQTKQEFWRAIGLLPRAS